MHFKSENNKYVGILSGTIMADKQGDAMLFIGVDGWEEYKVNK
jgi:hypothetical protein